MTQRLPAKWLSQQQQIHDYWLIRIQLIDHTDLAEWPIGTRFNWKHHQAWLFQQSGSELSLLSLGAWPMEDHQTLELNALIFQTLNNQAWSSASNQLWLGSELSQAAVFDAAKRWQQAAQPKGQFIALLHTQNHFAFQPKPAQFILDLVPEAIGAATLLEDYGVANRLASEQGLPGCYDGSLVDLYQAWLLQRGQQDWQVYGFLPTPLHQACQALSNNQTGLDFYAQTV